MKRIVPALVLLSAACFFDAASASPLAPGQGAAPSSATETGTLLGFEQRLFTFGPTNSPNRIVGFLQEGVFRETDGLLDFAYQIGLASNSAGNVATFTVADFTNVETDVAQASSIGSPFLPGADSWQEVIRSPDGSTVGPFFASTAIGAGVVSDIAIIRTNATAFDQLGSVTVANKFEGGVFGLSGTFEAISPGVTTTDSVPEPSIWAMMLLGFAGLGLIGWRSSRRSAVLVG